MWLLSSVYFKIRTSKWRRHYLCLLHRKLKPVLVQSNAHKLPTSMRLNAFREKRGIFLMCMNACVTFVLSAVCLFVL